MSSVLGFSEKAHLLPNHSLAHMKMLLINNLAYTSHFLSKIGHFASFHNMFNKNKLYYNFFSLALNVYSQKNNRRKIMKLFQKNSLVLLALYALSISNINANQTIDEMPVTTMPEGTSSLKKLINAADDMMHSKQSSLETTDASSHEISEDADDDADDNATKVLLDPESPEDLETLETNDEQMEAVSREISNNLSDKKAELMNRVAALDLLIEKENLVTERNDELAKEDNKIELLNSQLKAKKEELAIIENDLEKQEEEAARKAETLAQQEKELDAGRTVLLQNI
jgi:hypothetical protein